jgi:hypothetical protein
MQIRRHGFEWQRLGVPALISGWPWNKIIAQLCRVDFRVFNLKDFSGKSIHAVL